MDEPVIDAAPSPDTIAWAARRTIEMHREPPSDSRATGRCAQCTPGGGCEQLRWALQILGAESPRVVNGG